MNNTGDRIEIMLAKRKIPKVDFAKKLNITEQHLQLILKGESLSTVNMLQKISEILEVPTDYLLQDSHPDFLIFAIDDYLSMLDRDSAKSDLNELLSVIENEQNSEAVENE